ncbi:PQQ-dependent sugar dehydrogenase [Salibacterium aidingense]|uniref:PQQ-dependent sugar dehydrogenase n=1 Tax=Salibacterium aidingense TaxID=384933 RepID=UPI003BBC82E6
MLKKIVPAVFLLFVFSGCSTEEKSPKENTSPDMEEHTPEENDVSEDSEDDKEERSSKQADEAFSEQTIASSLNVPWAIQEHRDGFYVTERGGTIAHIDNNGKVDRQNVSLDKEVAEAGEGGLLGFQLAPDFRKSQKAYTYHTYEQNQNLANRIVSITLENGEWQESEVLLEAIPGGRIHNGGRLKIGPDDRLYATAGDAGNENQAQQLETLGGSILRMTLDGDIPEDNPIDDSYIYSYGHRNPQGISWNEEGALFSSEHGPSGHDEINRIEPGENYGWPEITGNESQNGMRPPLSHSGNDTWAPSGTAFDGTNDFYVTGLRGTQLMRFHVEEETMEVVYSGEGRLRDVLIAGDSMYVVTNNRDGRGNPDEEDDQLLKLEHFEEHVE